MRVAKKDSASALSQHWPVRPADSRTRSPTPWRGGPLAASVGRGDLTIGSRMSVRQPRIRERDRRHSPAAARDQGRPGRATWASCGGQGCSGAGGTGFGSPYCTNTWASTSESRTHPNTRPDAEPNGITPRNQPGQPQGKRCFGSFPQRRSQDEFASHPGKDAGGDRLIDSNDILSAATLHPYRSQRPGDARSTLDRHRCSAGRHIRATTDTQPRNNAIGRAADF